VEKRLGNKYMNIVDAIRKGKKDFPRAEELTESIVSFNGETVIGFCAFGAALVGEFGAKNVLRYQKEGILLNEAVKAFPQLHRKLKSPDTVLYKYIWYLNDKKGLTISQIADKLDVMGLK
jgi:hypothetical protein